MAPASRLFRLDGAMGCSRLRSAGLDGCRQARSASLVSLVVLPAMRFFVSVRESSCPERNVQGLIAAFAVSPSGRYRPNAASSGAPVSTRLGSVSASHMSEGSRPSRHWF